VLFVFAMTLAQKVLQRYNNFAKRTNTTGYLDQKGLCTNEEKAVPLQPES